MAYHNLDNANYPNLHPTAPVRYVELQSPQVLPQPLVAVPVPQERFPDGYIPYATPDASYAQQSQVNPPVAEPVHHANAVPGVYVPPPLTLEQLNAVLERRVNFCGCTYFGESKVFFKHNWCKLMTAVVMWALVFMTLGCAIHRINPMHGGYGGYYGGYGGYGHSSYPSTTTEPPTNNVPSPTYHYPGNSQVPEPHYGNEYGNYASQTIQSKAVLQMALLCLLSILIGMPAWAGMFAAVFNAMRTNGPLRFKDFFSCFSCRYFCRLIPLSVTLKVVTAILGIVIVPALWFAFVTIFAVPLHREHKFLGCCGSIRASTKIVHRYFCKMLGFLILNALLQVLGFFLCGIGLLFTIPISFVALCYCYNDLIGVNAMPVLVGEPQIGV